MSNPTEKPPISFNLKLIQHKDDPSGGHGIQNVGIDCIGEQTVPANWRTLGVYNDSDEPMRKAELLHMIPIFEMAAFDTPEAETSQPRDIWISDNADLSDENSSSPYQKFNWQPAAITIEPNKRKKHEKWKTKKKVIDIEEIETEQCLLWDPTVDEFKMKFTSEFKRSGNPIFGKNFAPPITFEFRGYTEALGLCCLAKNDKTPQKRTIDWVLYQNGRLSADEYSVNAIKHTIRGKLKYSVYLSGTMAADMRKEAIGPLKFKQYPIEFVFQYNGIEPRKEMYEEIELVYYTNITVSPVGQY